MIMSNVVSLQQFREVKANYTIKRNVKEIQAEVYATIRDALIELKVDLKNDIIAYEDALNVCNAFNACAINHHQRMMKLEM
jgi:hypothetical protein